MITKIRECDDALVELRAVLFEPALGVPNVTLLQHLNTCRSCRAILLLLMAETQPDGVPPASCAECLADLAAFIDVVRANPSAASEYPAVWWHLWLCPRCSETYQLTLELLDRSTARFDEAKITRCLHNLVRNAYEAMGAEGGKVTVRVLRDGPDLVITVADTGHGIPEEIRGRLFQSFVTAGKKGGTGLGLAIVKKIVEEHAGTVTYKSKPGKGTTFEVRFPAGVPAD